MSSRITYTCPICAGSMLETQSMEQERLSEVERLGEAVQFLLAALKRVQTRPMVESAFISAVCLEEASKRYGVRIEPIAKATRETTTSSDHRDTAVIKVQGEQS